MDWVRTAEEQQEGKRSGYVVLRDPPPRPTQRVCKLSTELQLSSRDLDLKLFPGSTDQQQKQLEAFHEAWQSINTTIKELRQRTLAPTFNQLQHWAADHGPVQHQHLPGPNCSSSSSSSAAAGRLPPASATAAAAGLLPCGSHQLPMVALSITSCTNTAATYAELLYTLKSKGHPVALVSARGASSGLSSTLNSAMRSFLNEPTAADDIPALLAWWQDVCQQHSSTADLQAAHATAKTPKKAVKEPITTGGCESGMDVDAATPQRGKAAAAAAATPARELRARTPIRPGVLKNSGGGGSGGSELKQLGPPVVVLQDADCGDMEALEELVVALSEARVSGLPIVLVLGISITPSHLLQLLPNGVLRRAQLTTLALPPARTQVAQLYRSLLLCCPQPPLILGPKISDWLLQHFRDVDCSAAMAERVLQLACAQHFMQQRLSCLAAAAATGSRKAVAAAVKQLTKEELIDCCRALLSHPAATAAAAASSSVQSPAKAPTPTGGKAADTAAAAAAVKQLQDFVKKGTISSNNNSSTNSRNNAAAAAAAAAAGVVLEAVWGAMQGYGSWRLGVLMLDLLARFTGVADVDASLQLPAIYTAASQPDFLTVKKKGNLSACGKLLLKLLGSSSSSSGRGRAGVRVVRALSDADCGELLGKLVELVADVQLSQKQRLKQQQQQQQRGTSTAVDLTGAETNDGDGSSSSSSESESESESEDESDHEGGMDAAPHADNAVACCQMVAQVQQALLQLQAAAAAAAAGPADTVAAVEDSHISPSKRQKQQPPQQQQQQQFGNHSQLSAFAERFSHLLAPWHDILEPAAAAAANGVSLLNTPASKGQQAAAAAAGSSQDAITPGGLASLLKRHVRFAPNTPDHANGKHIGSSSSARSTPEEQAAAPVPGMIKTPNKKNPGATQPKRLFAAAAAAAAANAAAAAAAKQPKRRKGEKKQAVEQGEIAGSSAAVLAAAAGLGQGPAAAAAAGNKRTQRLMQMMSAPSPPAAAAAAAAAAGGQKTAAGSSSSRSNPLSAAKADGSTAAGVREGIRTRGLLLTPPALDPAAAAAAAAGGTDPDGALLSPRATRGRSSRSIAAAAGGGEEPPSSSAAGMITSPVVGRTAAAAVVAAASASRGGSRLSRQSVPALLQQQQQQQQQGDDDDDHTEDDDDQLVTVAAAVAGDAIPQQQQQHKVPAAAAATCVCLLVALLEAVLPRLLLHWSCPTAVSSSSSSSVAGSSSIARSSSPLAAAAAAAFVYDDLDSISSMLSPAPPCAVHAALINPSQKLKGHPQDLQQGWEDTCLAYVLLQQQREESLAVTDWFGLYCQAQGLSGFRGNEGGLVGYNNDSDLEGEAADAAPGGRAQRRKARTGRKARGYAEARETAAAAAGVAADASRKGDSAKSKGIAKKEDQATPKSTGKRRAAAAAAAPAAAAAGSGGDVDDDDTAAAAKVDEQELLSAAARFCQAAAELQVLGVWKGAKKRRMAAVHRVFAPGGQLTAAAGHADVDSLADHDYE